MEAVLLYQHLNVSATKNGVFRLQQIIRLLFLLLDCFDHLDVCCLPSVIALQSSVQVPVFLVSCLFDLV